MSSRQKNNDSTTRRAFFQDVTAGATGVAIAGALAQLGAPVMAAQQQGAGPAAAQKGTGGPAPKSAASPFLKILRHGRRGRQATSMTIYSVRSLGKIPLCRI
jgi:hypothetical protein